MEMTRCPGKDGDSVEVLHHALNQRTSSPIQSAVSASRFRRKSRPENHSRKVSRYQSDTLLLYPTPSPILHFNLTNITSPNLNFRTPQRLAPHPNLPNSALTPRNPNRQRDQNLPDHTRPSIINRRTLTRIPPIPLPENHTHSFTSF